MKTGQGGLPIETERLRLRPASRAQMEAAIAAETDAELKAAYGQMLEGCLAHPDRWEWNAMWIIEDRAGTRVGDLCFKGLPPAGNPEVGYGILEARQGRGYATEALRAVTAWAFRDPRITAIEAEAAPENAASQRVLAKCGFVPNGVMGEEGPRYTLARPAPGRRTVRRAGEGDIPGILALLVQVDMVHHRGRPDLFKGPATKYNAAERRDLLPREETPVFVCADEAGRVLGHAFCVEKQEKDSHVLTDVKTLYIDDICVDEAARGTGVGRALYEAVKAYAKEHGFYNITLNVWACNPGALQFYERLGLVPQKIGMEAIL